MMLVSMVGLRSIGLESGCKTLTNQDFRGRYKQRIYWIFRGTFFDSGVTGVEGILYAR